MLKKITKHCFTIGIIMLLVMMKAECVGLSAENAGFRETFESFESHSGITTQRPYLFNGWKSIFYSGTTSMDLEAENYGLLDKKSIKFKTTDISYSSKTTLAGIIKPSNIVSKCDPVVLNAEVYLPKPKNGVRQLTRIIVSRGTSEETVTDSADIQVAYQPFRIASYGILFDTKGENNWKAYLMEPSQTNAYAEVAIETLNGHLKMAGGEKISVSCVYYPDKMQTDYFINGIQVSSGSRGYKAKMEKTGEIGNVILLSGCVGEEQDSVSFDNVEIYKLDNYCDTTIFEELKGNTKNVAVKWNIPLDVNSIALENISVERFAPEDVFLAYPQKVYEYSIENITQNGLSLVFDEEILKDGEKYRVTIKGKESLYGLSKKCIYEFVSKEDAAGLKAVRFSDENGKIFSSCAAGAKKLLLYTEDAANINFIINGNEIDFVGEKSGDFYELTLVEPIPKNAECVILGISKDKLIFNSGNYNAHFSIDDASENAELISARVTGYGKPECIQVDGNYLWKITADANKSILFDINGLGNSEDDGSSYLVEIEYYDYPCEIPEDDKHLSFFTIWADILTYGRQRVKDIPLLGDGKWKKTQFELEYADFKNDEDILADIVLSLYDRKSVSEYVLSYVPLYFKSIKIEKIERKNPVIVESYIENTGNTFKYYEEKQVLNTFTNTQNKDIDLKAKYCLTDAKGNIKFSFEEKFSIQPNTTVERVVDVDCTECGLYQWIIHIEDESDEIDIQVLEDTVAIVKTAQDGLKNPSAWIACHLERYPIQTQKMCLELINNANIEGVRLQVPWYRVENSEGLNIERCAEWEAAKICEEYGVNYWVLLLGSNVFYQDAEIAEPRKIPTTEKELEGWEKFCKYVIEKYANRGVELFEIWNEPNINSFNPMEGTPAQLAEITRRAKKAANELFAEAKISKAVKIAGLSVTNINDESTYQNWVKPAVDSGIAMSGKGMDVINLHTYQAGIIPEQIKSYNSVQKFKDYIEDTAGVKDIPVLISEYGNSTLHSFVTEDARRDWTVRSLILYKMYGIGDQVAVYNLEQKGALTKCADDHFGIVSPIREELNVEGKNGIPTETYLSYAAMNYVLRGGITPVEILDCGENIKINHLKRDKFDDDVLALWTAYDSAEIILELGDTSVVSYDCFGNESVLKSENGRYKIPIDTSVKYIVGNFTNVRLVEAEQAIYESFSEHKFYVPHKWVKSSILGTINTGTQIGPISVDEEHGTSLYIASRNINGEYGNHAVSREIGYVIKNDAPVIFHTDFMINKSTEANFKGNSYQICVTKSSDIEDIILGFKIQERIGYWDESRGDFVFSNKVIDPGKWVRLDAIYYPDTKLVHYYADDVEIARATAGIGENKVLETVMLSGQTLDSTANTTKSMGIYDNILLMPYDTQKAMFFEKNHLIKDGKIAFNNMTVNLFNSTKEANILTAFYDVSGRMVDIFVQPILIEAKTIKNVSTDLFDANNWLQAKVFVWDKESLMPSTSVYEVKKN